MATSTTKYFKFGRVDADAGYSVISYPSDNKVLPDLPGLSVFWAEGEWYYGTADADAEEDTERHIYCITEEEVYSHLSDSIEGLKRSYLDRISEYYIKICEDIDSKYPEESSAIGAQRYSDAKDSVSGKELSDLLKEEIAVSGQDFVSLCAGIISSYEEYQSKHARLTGLKKLISDKISSYTITEENFVEDFNKFYSEREDLGNSFENPNIIGAYSKDPLDIEFDPQNNYTIRKYSPNLYARWEVLK